MRLIAAVSVLALAAHWLVANGLRDRIEQLDDNLAACRIQSATATANEARLEAALARVESDLADAAAAEQQARQAARQAAQQARRDLEADREADQSVGPEPEAMNEWLHELF